MCKGGACTGATNISWVTSGPHPLWSSFMNTYAVFASNQNPLLDAAQSATYIINIPTTGNYDFECQADNSGTFTLDGTQIATSTSFTSSTTTTLSSLFYLGRIGCVYSNFIKLLHLSSEDQLASGNWLVSYCNWGRYCQYSQN